MSNAVEYINDAQFESYVTQSDVPVLLDFYADWCGPCRSIAPVLEELAAEYDGKVKIAKIDVDKNQITAGKFQVRSIPTMILFKNGEQLERIVGADINGIRSAIGKSL